MALSLCHSADILLHFSMGERKLSNDRKSVILSWRIYETDSDGLVVGCMCETTDPTVIEDVKMYTRQYIY